MRSDLSHKGRGEPSLPTKRFNQRSSLVERSNARIKSGHDELICVDVFISDISPRSRRAIRARVMHNPALGIAREQGMPGAHRTRGLAWKIKTRELVTTVAPETPGIPRAMVLTASFVISSVSRAFLPPSPRNAKH
jgi:hypothetical protein